MVQKTDKLNEDDQKVYLDPGQSLSVFKSNGQMIQSSFDPKKVLSWKDGIIYFDDAVFEEVVEVLERWYGKTIIVQNIEKAGDGSLVLNSITRRWRMSCETLAIPKILNTQLKEKQ